MIRAIAEHTVDVELLANATNNYVIGKANVMDIGCRGFLFADEMVRLGHKVYPIDIDLLHPCSMKYFIAAIAGHDGECSVEYSKDPQATKMTAGCGVKMYTIKSFSEYVNIPFWDLIKMDIEGSEYEVIMSLTEPPAKQLSIEFHLHTKIYGDAQVKQMEDKLLSLGYYPAKHDKTQAHGMGFNYWDSLFILK